MMVSDSCTRGLGLHTTSTQLGLSLSRQDRKKNTKVWNVNRQLSSRFHKILQEFIQPQEWKDINFVAVAKGPGSFTGTRIGMTAARTIAQQLEIPLFSISTLAAFAWFHKNDKLFKDFIAIQMKASRGQIYGAVYEKKSKGNGLITVIDDTVMELDKWKKVLEDMNLFCEPLIVTSEIGVTACSILELAEFDWEQGKRPHFSESKPFYGYSSITK
ncbi:MAG: tRNA (adenosine(37)-N6)-threonylcarbamoyltransferase complex dimerization subunit type 1 TsaB [Candidatus Atelocyanobacterium thalassa]|uniref:tRNA threonylcarbamoyl adenosine modification protein YeaZ n=1 Tax=Candidatus Atelocyanobacterium thalassa isolate SIO64986 TaxID=1527444 RepID=A0A086CH80_9CHRO|nr:MAG: tRNA threonylcarbamoyl adenosine modification protein YeaZ [Candidatus Atelocyanobacterium thalassa isolate SIO64986]